MADQAMEQFNRENNHSLYDFLAYYGGIPLQISNPRHGVEIVDIRLDALTINYTKNGRSKTTIIPFSPPLKGLDQAGVRLQLMAFEAADALRVSPFCGDKYLYPSLGGAAVIASLVTGVVLSVSPRTSYRVLMRRFPRLAAFVRDKLRKIVLLLLFVHAWEYATFLRPRLDRFRVFGLTRYRWMLTCLFEGFPSWVRYYRYTDGLTQERREFERRAR